MVNKLNSIKEKEGDIEVLGKLPLNPEAAQIADEGRFFEIENEELLSRAIEVLESKEKINS